METPEVEVPTTEMDLERQVSCPAIALIFMTEILKFADLLFAQSRSDNAMVGEGPASSHHYQESNAR